MNSLGNAISRWGTALPSLPSFTIRPCCAAAPIEKVTQAKGPGETFVTLLALQSCPAYQHELSFRAHPNHQDFQALINSDFIHTSQNRCLAPVVNALHSLSPSEIASYHILDLRITSGNMGKTSN